VALISGSITRSLFSRVEIELDLLEKTQIVGHTIKSKKEIEAQVKNQSKWVYLDNGCVYGGEDNNYGSLCCLELRNDTLIFQENID